MQQPPPPSPPAPRRVTSQTGWGVGLVLASPLVLFLSFAVAASFVDESRLEDGGDLQWVSFSAMAASVLVGIAVVVADLSKVRFGRDRRFALVMSLVAIVAGAGLLALAGIVLSSSAANADPAIGVAFLLLAGLVLLVGGAIYSGKRLLNAR